MGGVRRYIIDEVEYDTIIAFLERSNSADSEALRTFREGLAMSLRERRPMEEAK